MNAPANANLWARALVEQNRRWLMAYFLSACGDPHAAEDLTQEVFCEALAFQDRYDPTKSFGGWLRGIARNLLLQYYRKSRRVPVLVESGQLDRLDAQAELSRNRDDDPGHRDLRVKALQECLKGLTDRGRAMLQLRYARGLISKEIGEQLGMQAEAVDMAMSRARKALGQCVEQRLGAAHG